ncbi:YdeI/OmpD-associated family protein [Roseateles sp. SL47]|uniref:YdeI/OmpD-associated family protein n=1 Tax=Roseateles sp. SL47 TaxID=2995138 RepID=UPI00226E8070|nr:YdeI/OmpD-associated family protein [Roseateles sp. SL47]WAC75125.1 YdeI/OmpD-associated family protein [Roseateles sp. SL47]
MATRTPHFFPTAADFRDWLDQHASTATDLVVGFYKRGSGLPSLDWPESVDEALCHGWIDGVRTRIDDKSYKIRFSPRKANSIWSAVNIARMEALIKEGRVREAGLAAFEARSDARSRVYSHEQDEVEFTPAQEVAFRHHPAAWEFFRAQAPSYQRSSIWHVLSAKKADTQITRLNRLIEASARGERL